jgi:hypothetical protein
VGPVGPRSAGPGDPVPGVGLDDRPMVPVAVRAAAVAGAGVGVLAAVRPVRGEHRGEDLLPGRRVRVPARGRCRGRRRVAAGAARPAAQPAAGHRGSHGGDPARSPAGAPAHRPRPDRRPGEPGLAGYRRLAAARPYRRCGMDIPAAQPAGQRGAVHRPYGEAGAINELGRGTGLPTAVSSQNSG